MPKGYCIANTGGGKTLWASLYAVEWSYNHPNGKIYANYHLNLPNANFSPNMFLNFKELKDCLIIYDDVSNLGTIKRFTKVCANRSRKRQMELIFLGQYYAMVDRQLRFMADYKVKVELNRVKDVLKAIILLPDGNYKIVYYYNVISYVKKYNLYDTNEVVDEPTESDIINEIINISTNRRDIEKNLMIYSGDKGERKQLLKEIFKKIENHPGDQDEKQTNGNFEDEINYYHDKKHLSFKKIAEILGTTDSKVKYYYYKKLEMIEKTIKLRKK